MANPTNHHLVPAAAYRPEVSQTNYSNPALADQAQQTHYFPPYQQTSREVNAFVQGIGIPLYPSVPVVIPFTPDFPPVIRAQAQSHFPPTFPPPPPHIPSAPTTHRVAPLNQNPNSRDRKLYPAAEKRQH